jgi:hypothetical protein
VRANVGSTQGTTSGVEETVEYGTETEDVTGEYNTGTYTYTANSHRRLRVFAQVRGPDSAVWILRIRKNGSTRAESNPQLTTKSLSVSDTFSVAPGDTVTIRAVQGDGDRDITADDKLSYLTIEEVAA